MLGEDPDAELMRRAGIRATTVGGCCGLAGNFGYEAGHLDVSLACAEHELLPGLRGTADDALVIADGFSCRTQVEQTGSGRQAMHLAEVLAAALRGGLGGGPEPPERRAIRRPGRPQRVRGLARHLPRREREDETSWPV